MCADACMHACECVHITYAFSKFKLPNELIWTHVLVIPDKGWITDTTTPLRHACVCASVSLCIHVYDVCLFVFSFIPNKKCFPELGLWHRSVVEKCTNRIFLFTSFRACAVGSARPPLRGLCVSPFLDLQFFIVILRKKNLVSHKNYHVKQLSTKQAFQTTV